jgi:hypothetical protein
MRGFTGVLSLLLAVLTICQKPPASAYVNGSTAASQRDATLRTTP